MSKLTVADAAIKLGISKEAIHNRIRRGSLKSVIIDGVKLVVLDAKTITSTPRRITTKQTTNTSSNDARYYKLLEEQNAKLQSRVDMLEGETRSLRDQKEQMLIDERTKIEQIYKDKDEQLKNILSAFSSKLMLDTPKDTNEEEVVEAEVHEKQVPQERLISLNKHLKSQNFTKKKREKIKEKFKSVAKTDSRIITIGKKHYIDLAKYDYSDLSL